MTTAEYQLRRSFFEELRKLPAFFRRDFLTAISYPLAFFSDWISLFVQIALFAFIAKIVQPEIVPNYGGRQPSYLEFVAVGIIVTSFMQLALARTMGAVRREQMIGTLEPLLMAPINSATVQVGSVAYDLVYVPIRTFLYLAIASWLFDVSFMWSGLGPVLLVLLTFIPFVWGLGVIAAAGILTFRKSSAAVGFGLTILIMGSGTYFPINVLPEWIQPVAENNPVAIAMESTREALLAGAGWADIAPDLVKIIPFSLITLGVGAFAFRIALDRERRRGTLGLY